LKRIPAAVFVACTLILAVTNRGGGAQRRPEPDFEKLPFAPRSYVCYRPAGSLVIDGKLAEPSWNDAPWTEGFLDIEGDSAPRPRFATRAKMLWDDEHFYFAADMEEPHLWATLTERDSVIFQDNDFEIFIDPDGDTHNYFELEINALGTVWDLMLVQPYRDGGPAIHAWDVAGLKSAVGVRGTINRPDDRDDGWSVEMAIPWKILAEAAPGRRRPRAGERWRVNFSRVQWHLDVAGNRYAKRTDGKTGKPLPEDNWVWSPQGAVNMHMPERWGVVQFAEAAAGARPVSFQEDPNERVKWALRRLYYRQRRHLATTGRYASTLDGLDAGTITVEGLEFRPTMQATDTLYGIRVPGFDGSTVRIRQDGRAWLTK
jgi:Carbohydrate family 9 binding domain-like